MTSFSTTALFIVTLVLLTGCDPVPRNNPPAFDVDREVAEYFKSMKTCDTPDKFLEIPAEARQSPILIEEEIENKDYALVDCDGTIKDKGHGPVRLLTKDIVIEAPSTLKSKVNFVTVKNARTCVSQTLQTMEDPTPGDTKPAKGEEVNPLQGLSFAFRSGKTLLSLIGSDMKDYMSLNVLDGNNVIEITYYGKCLKYDEEAKEELPDSIRCKEAEILAKKSALVQVKVKRTEATGVRNVDVCGTKTSMND